MIRPCRSTREVSGAQKQYTQSNRFQVQIRTGGLERNVRQPENDLKLRLLEVPVPDLQILDRDAGILLSIVMRVFNEERTILQALRRVLSVAYPCRVEVLIVDDGSVDRTTALLDRIDDRRVRVQRHDRNRGKGAAVLTGIKAARGSHLLVFDADLEYDPADIPALLSPIISQRAKVVYGSRIQGVHTAYQSLHYAVGSRATTWLANILFNAYLKDLHTCLKLLPLDLVRQLDLRERGFGLDTEVTAKVLRLGIRPYEVPISYYSRTRDEGKKITWQDGFSCISILMRVRRQAVPSVRHAPALARIPAQSGSRSLEAGSLPSDESVA